MTRTASAFRASARVRVIACLLALPIGLVLADIGFGKYWVEAERYRGPHLPPFDLASNQDLTSWLERQRGMRSASIAQQSCGVFDPELGWHNRQGSSWPHGRRVSINSLGARSTREYTELPREGVTRVACFGDSFVFGSEVSDEEVWCAQLEANVEQLEVMNFGAAGYGLDQALLRFRRMSPVLHADVLVIGLQIEGITRIVNRCRPLLVPGSKQIMVKPRFLLREGELELVPLPFRDRREFLACAARGELLEALADHEHWTTEDPLLPGSSLLRLTAAHRAARRRNPYPHWGAVEREPFQLMLALLEEFRREARAAGLREIVLLLFPDRQSHAEYGAGGSKRLEPLRQQLREREWSWIDFDVLLGEELQDPSSLFLAAHFNAVGNARVADAVHSWLRDRGGAPR